METQRKLTEIEMDDECAENERNGINSHRRKILEISS